MSKTSESERAQLQRIAGWIQGLRGSRTQVEMADEIKVSKNTIKNIESGEGNPEAATILQILNRCGVTPTMKEFAHGRAEDVPLHEQFQALLDHRVHRNTVATFVATLHSSLPKAQKRAS